MDDEINDIRAGLADGWSAFDAEDVAALVARIDLLESRLRNAEERLQMSCESPPPGCDCAGCSYAAEVNARDDD